MDDTAPRVGVIMGSQSDWPTMAHAVQILDQFGIAHEVRIVSAHRTPDRLVDYAKAAAGRGLLAIIAGAGGAAASASIRPSWPPPNMPMVEPGGSTCVQPSRPGIGATPSVCAARQASSL